MKKIVFWLFLVLLIYSCIPKDNFILPNNGENKIKDTTIIGGDSTNGNDSLNITPGGGDSTTKDSTDNSIIENPVCSPDTIYFEQAVFPIILSNCALSGCHDAKTKEEGYDYSNYAGIRKSVNINSPKDSKLYKVLFEESESDDDSKFPGIGPTLHQSLSDRMPPAPMKELSADQKSTILSWIQQGALNNSCSESANSNNCDLTNITFSKNISKIIETNCLGCHDSNSGQNSTLLNSYNNILIQVNNKKLLGSIQHDTGFIPMPSAQTKLDPCSIEKIKTWISEGAKNN